MPAGTGFGDVPYRNRDLREGWIDAELAAIGFTEERTRTHDQRRVSNTSDS